MRGTEASPSSSCSEAFPGSRSLSSKGWASVTLLGCEFSSPEGTKKRSSAVFSTGACAFPRLGAAVRYTPAHGTRGSRRSWYRARGPGQRAHPCPLQRFSRSLSRNGMFNCTWEFVQLPLWRASRGWGREEARRRDVGRTNPPLASRGFPHSHPRLQFPVMR